MRHALNCLALVAPDWLRAHSQPEWVERYEARMEDARTPQGDEARQAFAEVIGADGASLLSAIYDAAAPNFLREIPAVEILRWVWIQNYTWIDGKISGALPKIFLQPHGISDHLTMSRRITVRSAALLLLA